MAGRIGKALSSVLFWTYARGTWQYDLLCVIILVFIFLTPRSFFTKSLFYGADEPKKMEQKNRKTEQKQALLSPLAVTGWRKGVV
jgi:hypothetical protein